MVSVKTIVHRLVSKTFPSELQGLGQGTLEHYTEA